MQASWRTVVGTGPLVAAAVHDGHDVRDEVGHLLALDEPARLREEDPHTAGWAAVAPTRIIGGRSRFEVDLNRSREKAVYRRPEDAWGLDVWRSPPSSDLVDRSLAQYDAFYADAHRLLETVRVAHGAFVVFDLHTYNHRRDGVDGPPADPAGNPEVNIGTGTMDRGRWGPLVQRFMRDLSAVEVQGRRLDVRENVKFQGGQFSRWVHETFPGAGCSIAIEFKKFFMDEWTGELDLATHASIRSALEATIPGVLEECRHVASKV